MTRDATPCSSLPPIVLIGATGDPRVASFQSALLRFGCPAAQLVDYRALLEDPSLLATTAKAGALVRIESPGRDAAVLAGLLARGVAPSEARGEAHVPCAEIEALFSDKGRLLPARQIHRGLMALLTDAFDCTSGLRARPDLATIALAFDKTACHAHVTSHAVATPKCIPDVTSFTHLIEEMRQRRLPRVFIKLRHGSAASGVIALATSPRGMTATTTIDLIETAGRIHLYNTRRVKRLTNTVDIARLVAALLPFGVHVEEWIAKAGIEDHATDLRVLVVAGEPAHVVLRMSKHPMTNLHLGGMRANADRLLVRMSDAARESLFATARKTARLFPGALHLGLDIAVAADLRRHALLEVNVFGDLLKGVLHDGLDPYELQVTHLRRMTVETPA